MSLLFVAKNFYCKMQNFTKNQDPINIVYELFLFSSLIRSDQCVCTLEPFFGNSTMVTDTTQNTVIPFRRYISRKLSFKIFQPNKYTTETCIFLDICCV